MTQEYKHGYDDAMNNRINLTTHNKSTQYQQGFADALREVAMQGELFEETF